MAPQTPPEPIANPPDACNGNTKSNAGVLVADNDGDRADFHFRAAANLLKFIHREARERLGC